MKTKSPRRHWGKNGVLNRVYAIFLLCLFAGFGGPGSAMAADGAGLDLIIHHRPPLYVVGKGDQIGGILGDRAKQVFAEAGVSFSWRVLSAKGSMREIQLNRKAACAVGWFKNKEREQFAKYTLPLRRDPARP